MKIRIHLMLIITVLASLIISCSSASLPSVGFSFTKHNFGTVRISEFEETTLIISNKRNKILTLSKFTMQNYEFMITQGGTANTRVQPKTDHEVHIKFYPALPGGIKESTLTIEYTYDIDPMYKEIFLEGNSMPIPKIALNPTSADFGRIVIGTTKTKDFLVANTGTATMSITSLQISGLAASDYSITNGSAGLLNASMSMKITVQFAPIVVGTKDAVLEIHHDGVNELSPIVSQLTGEGYDVPVFSVTPTSYDFGLIAKGDIDSTIFTIENLGGADMNITNINPSGDFTIISGGAPFPVVINPGKTHDIEVQFKPSSYGQINGVISIISDTLTTPDSFSVKGEGFRGLPFEEDFEGVSPGQKPQDWTISTGPSSTTGGSTQYSWQVANDASPYYNETGGSGKYIAALSDKYDKFYEDYIETPAIDCTTYTTGSITLEFDGKLQTYLNKKYELAAVEVYDGAGWVQLDSWDQDWNSTGEHKTYTVTQYARGNSNFKVRFFYTTQYIYLKWFMIDNLKISR